MEKIAEMFGGNLYLGLLIIALILILVAYLVSSKKGIRKTWKSRGIKNAWSEISSSLRKELNRGGAEIVRILIEIAFINADSPSSRELGNIEKEVKIYGHEPDFYTKLPGIIEGINDNNHNVAVNGKYAHARDAINEAISLIEKFSQARGAGDAFFSALAVGGEKVKDEVDPSNMINYNNLAVAIIEAHEAQKAIAQAVKNLNGIFSALKYQQSLAAEEKEQKP